MSKTQFKEPSGPAGGWGSVEVVSTALLKEHIPVKGAKALQAQNKVDGFSCVSCAWAKPAKSHPFEFCQNGALATAWEITAKRADSEFFLDHTLADLEGWTDHELEERGRLTVPLRWDAPTDRYIETTWEQAFKEISFELQQLDPTSAVWYTSGRASLETSYMYALMVRMYGSNNLPDSSNMCHESTSVALQESIGVGVGTVVLEDFDQADCILFFGQNVGTNSPRMLHDLQAARKRGIPIITFNPLLERGLVSFTNPQSPSQMLTGQETTISTHYHQVKPGGDIAALTGICKAIFKMDYEAITANQPRVLDIDFITKHTSGFDEFEDFILQADWVAIERESGLTRAALEETAKIYSTSSAVIGIFGMGLTQHRNGVHNVQMLNNLLMLRGNLGKPGAGICPVRGHSNVQGQRTVGITEKPELAPLDKLAELYHFEPPREKGLNTVETCEGIIDESVKAFIGLGGNFLRAVPETDRMEPAWRKLRLTVNIATKLNRSHVIHGEVSYLLPCLGRIEVDRQSSGEQTVSVEDSTGRMHGSRGQAEPASQKLLSETQIVAQLATALFPNAKNVDWLAWASDYSLIRSAIEDTYPSIFSEYETRQWIPGGFRRPMPVLNREWNTKNQKANFVCPDDLSTDPDTQLYENEDTLRLFTIRSDGQFNTTVYNLNDKFRGVYGTRKVLFICEEDLNLKGFKDGDVVTVTTSCTDDIVRKVENLRLTKYNVPKGCVAGYFPECNPLIPLWHHASKSMVPAAKSIPIKLSLQSCSTKSD
jgi:formate dehydrogenase major subunit